MTLHGSNHLIELFPIYGKLIQKKNMFQSPPTSESTMLSTVLCCDVFHEDDMFDTPPVQGHQPADGTWPIIRTLIQRFWDTVDPQVEENHW